MKAKYIVLTMVILSVLACQYSKRTAVPEHLTGVWVTSAPTYEQCAFQLKDGRLIFENGLKFVDVNFIKKIKELQEGNAVIYHICYENSDGYEFNLIMSYAKESNGPVIRFKNQKNIEWIKKEMA